MHRILGLLATCLLLLSFNDPAWAKGGGGGRSHASHSSSHSTSSHAKASHVSSRTSHSTRRKASGIKRDKHGEIARSQKARNEFKKSHPCPSTGKSSGACPGYVIDHVQALKHGGADKPSNMQWQTKQAAKEKDKRE